MDDFEHIGEIELVILTIILLIYIITPIVLIEKFL